MIASNSSTPPRLPHHARDLLSSCPSAGLGVHQWLFKCARALHAYLPDKKVMVDLLVVASLNCGREVPLREIEAAVRDSLRGGSCTKHGAAAKRPPWPAKNYEQIEAITLDGLGLADLWEISPFRIEKNHSPDFFIDALFPGNPLLCVGRSSSIFSTRSRSEWRGQLAENQFIVPSAMSSVMGKTKDGKPSMHTLDNTGPRQFLVVECDFSEKDKLGKDTADASLIRAVRDQGRDVPDICATVLARLAKLAPLAMVVHSGGKSLHGWFRCAGQPEDKLHLFMRCAVAIGGDCHTWTRSQFVRMPGGRRDNGKLQAVYFFNPKILEVK